MVSDPEDLLAIDPACDLAARDLARDCIGPLKFPSQIDLTHYFGFTEPFHETRRCDVSKNASLEPPSRQGAEPPAPLHPHG
jgi:hypothetical protein